jgi:hypothetical protein
VDVGNGDTGSNPVRSRVSRSSRTGGGEGLKLSRVERWADEVIVMAACGGVAWAGRVLVMWTVGGERDVRG